MSNGNIHRQNYTGAGASKTVASALNRFGRQINNVRGVGGLNIHTTGDAIEIMQSAGSSFPWSKLCLGFTIAGAVVTIKGGEVLWGTNAPVEIGDTNVTLTTDYQYVGIQFTGGVLSILGPSTDKATFRPDATVWRTWLYQFRLVSGVAGLYRIGRMAGNVEIPAWFGP